LKKKFLFGKKIFLEYQGYLIAIFRIKITRNYSSQNNILRIEFLHEIKIEKMSKPIFKGSKIQYF